MSKEELENIRRDIDIIVDTLGSVSESLAAVMECVKRMVEDNERSPDNKVSR